MSIQPEQTTQTSVQSERNDGTTSYVRLFTANADKLVQWFYPPIGGIPETERVGTHTLLVGDHKPSYCSYPLAVGNQNTFGYNCSTMAARIIGSYPFGGGYLEPQQRLSPRRGGEPETVLAAQAAPRPPGPMNLSNQVQLYATQHQSFV